MGKTSGKYIAAIHRNIQIYLNEQLKDMEIRSGQHDFLYVIMVFEGLTQKELSERLIVGKSTTAKAVKQLMDKGFVRREVDQQDKRMRRLYLTKKGQEAKPVIEETFKNLNRVLFGNLDNMAYRQLSDTLQGVLTNIAHYNLNVKEED